MQKKYPLLLFVLTLLFVENITSQEIQIFTRDDFDLTGDVKTSFVSTKYGKEEYEFSREGLLTKAVTRYSDSDYDVTYYKYNNGMLLEKRLENYRENEFDESTSIASFYTIDTLLNLEITEKILMYTKEFLDQYQYFYSNDSLNRIIHTNNSGIDETLISYSDVKGEQTKTYEINGVILKSVRTSYKKENDSITERNVLTKKFLDGEPITALEEIFNGTNKTILITKYFFNKERKEFAEEEKLSYFYDDMNVLSKTKKVINNSLEEEEYLYQFDQNGNWIKEIITPRNAYKTRKITYYELEESEAKEQ